MTSGKSVALVQSRAAPSTVTRATDFPAVINVGYCPRVRAITNTYYYTCLVHGDLIDYQPGVIWIEIKP